MLSKNKLRKVIIKTNGKKRLLYTYPRKNSQIRKRHELYIEFIDGHFIPSKFSHAYTKRRSIYTNGVVHLKNRVFVKMDVENFFPSLSHDYLVQAMYYELNKEKQDSIALKECAEIVNNSSVNRRGLPLGLLPSPILSNIYMKKIDSVFYGRLRKMNLNNVLYSRYADDLFISFNPKGDYSADDIIKLCSRELKKCHLRLNKKKTKVVDLNKSNHVKVAGVNITMLKGNKRRLTVGRDAVRQLYFKAISAHNSIDSMSDFDIQQIKGMHSFILSIEKTGYSHRLAKGMRLHIQSLGFESLESLIVSLGKNIP